MNRSLFWLIVVVFIVTIPVECFSASIRLDWDDNIESDLAGYKIYMAKTLVRSWAEVANVVGKSSTCIDIADADYNAGVIFAVTAYDTAGIESERSNEAVALPGNIAGDSSDGIIPENIVVDNEDFALIEFYWGDRNISHIVYNCAIDFIIVPGTDQQKADSNRDGRINIFDQLGVTIRIGSKLH